jgi:hypothetical protein
MIRNFDFLIRSWSGFNTRLTKLFCDCSDWVDFESQHIEKKLSNSAGNAAFHCYVLSNVFRAEW